MESCFGDRRCLICRRAALIESSSTNSEKLVSNASSLLQDFLKCFHINVLDSEVSDLATSCHFCRTCEQFIAEWSSIQTQMTQLTRRALQLEATLSARLLSAHEIQEQNHSKDVTEIINNRIQNSQDIELPLLLQQTVDDIRNELRKKYSVRVLLNKITLPCVQRLDHLSVSHDIVNEPWDHSEFGTVYSDEEHLLSEQDPLNDGVTPGQFLDLRIKTEEEANFDEFNFQDSVINSEKMSVKGRSERKRKRYADQAIIIPLGPSRFKYKGMSFKRNEPDETYTCDACGFKSGPSIKSIRGHIIHHFTRRDYSDHVMSDKNQHPPVLKLDPLLTDNATVNKAGDHWECQANIQLPVVPKIEPSSGGNDDDDEPWELSEFGAGDSDDEYLPSQVELNDVETSEQIFGHMQTQHVELEGPNKVVDSLTVSVTSSVNDSISFQGKLQSVPYTFNPVDNKYTCGLCQTQVPTRNKFRSHVGKSHRAPPKKIPCKICGIELTKRSLQSHAKAHEDGPMECPTCFKQFLSASGFKRHVEVHELGEKAKKHECKTCGKRFFTREHCEDHQRLHTGEKPYQCQICGNRFPGSSYLTRHRQSAHGIQPKSRRVMKVSK